MADRIPIEKWGRDHWSTFAYLMSVIAGQAGRIDHRKMRCGEHHPGLEHIPRYPGMTRSPTRLKDHSTIDEHDDWDCLDDIVAEGLLKHVGTGCHPGVVSDPSALAIEIAKQIWAREQRREKWSEVDLEAARALVPNAEARRAFQGAVGNGA